MTYNEVLTAARGQMGPCKACPVCDGRACRNTVPGPGAKGVGDVAIRNYSAWQNVRVNMDTICESGEPDTTLEMFGHSYRIPVFAGPVGAMQLHYGTKYTDLEYNDILVPACHDAGILAFTGDGTNPAVMVGACKAVKANAGFGIPTVKPWDAGTIAEKMALVRATGAFAVAMDIDAAGLPFLKGMTPPAGSKTMERMGKAMDEMRSLNMGGTAIGTGINADETYLRRIVPVLSEVSGMELTQAGDLIDSTQNPDPFVAVSGAVKTCAVTLSKIANDLRLMSSGPRTGFGEINLPARQNGSSIMPGKVNPVIPEVINQVAFLIIGNDMTVTMAAEGGQLELNAFEPIIFYCLFQSIGTLTYAVHTFVDNCVTGITANEERCRELVESSVGVITALTPHIGYQHAAAIAKRAIVTGQSVRKLILQEKLLTEEEIDTILDPMNLTKPGIPGKELLAHK